MYASYRAAAQRYGLTMIPENPGVFTSTIQLTGEVGEHPVRLRRLVGLHCIETEVYLKPGLDLGLDLTPAGQPPYPGAFGTLRFIGRMFSRADLHVGDAKVDDAFSIHGDEESRVRTLLEPLRAALLSWNEVERHFHLTDSLVSVRRYSPDLFGEDVQDIVADLDGALDLARRLEAQRLTLPPATALAPHIRGFEAFAAARATQVTTTPLVTWGTLRGRSFWAKASRIGTNQFAVVMAIELAAPLPETPQRDARLPYEAESALRELEKSGHRVVLGAGGLSMQLTFGKEPYDLDANVALAEEVLDRLERSYSKHSGYR